MTVKANAPLGVPTGEYLGPGAIYFNYGEASEVVVGATKGGGEFNDGAEFRQREADGDLGPVKGAIDLIKLNPILTVNALKIDKTNLQKFFAGMSLDDADAIYSKLTRMVDLTNSYIENVAFVGQNRSGTDMVIILYNALGDGALVMAFTKDEEIVPEVQFTATFDPTTFDRTDPDTYPYQIWLQKAADSTAPTVTTVPLDTAIDVAINANVVWTFSEAIQPACVNDANFYLMKADGTLVAGDLTIGTNDTVVTFNPTANLANNTDYLAIATKNVKDLAGNSLAATSVANFKTVA
jgi:hypothetical protein